MLLKLRHKPLYQSDFSIIEVLVAPLLTSIGVLGMIATQDKTIQYTTDSAERNKTVMLGSNLLESMRVSPRALYDVKDQMATQSGFFKARRSASPTTPSSCMPLPDAVKDHLRCQAEQVRNELPGAGDLPESDCYACRSSRPGDYDGKGPMLEIHLARHGEQGAYANAADNSAGTPLCCYTLRVEP